MHRTCPHLAPPSHHRPQTGMTLLEVTVALLVVALCTSLAIPSYQYFVHRQQAAAVQNLLTSHFASARQAAVTHRRITAVCPSNGPDQGCRQDGNWSHGWLMFFDPDGDRMPNLPQDVLRYETVPLPDSFRINSSSGRPQLRYLPSGRSAGSNLTVRICRKTTLLSEVVVNNAGRIRSRRGDSDDHCPP